MTTGRDAELGSCWRAIATLIAALGGCVVSPQPSPPFAPTLDSSRIIQPEGISTFADEVHLEGVAGTVDPPEGLVVVTDLDTQDAPTLAEVEDDGGFAVSFTGHPGEVVRFQVKQGDARSRPVDLLLGEAGSTLSSATSVRSCVEIAPDGWLSLGEVGEGHDVVVRNTCAAEVAIAAPRLRRGRAPIVVTPAAGVALPAGGEARFTVSRGGTGDEREDVLYLDLTGAVVERRALTVTLPD